MTRTGYLALLAAVTFATCSRPTPEQQIVNDAAAALGGAERILAVKTIVMEGEGTQYNLGQDVVPNASGQTFTVTEYKRSIDVPAGRARTELTRQPNFTFFQGPAAQRQVQGIDGAVGYNVAPNGTANRIPDPAVSDRRAELLHHPITAVRAALDPMAALSNPRTDGGQSIVDVSTPSGPKFTLAIDAATKLPSRVTTMTDNTNLGDVAFETSFADYQDVSGLKLPMRISSKIDKYPNTDISIATRAPCRVGLPSAPTLYATSPSTPKSWFCGAAGGTPAGTTATRVCVCRAR